MKKFRVRVDSTWVVNMETVVEATDEDQALEEAKEEHNLNYDLPDATCVEFDSGPVRQVCSQCEQEELDDWDDEETERGICADCAQLLAQEQEKKRAGEETST